MLNEAKTLPALLADLAPLTELGAELIVADGGSDDATGALAEAAGARVVVAERGRGRQLRAGIGASSRSMFLALHADVRLPPETVDWIIEQGVSQGAPIAFRLRVDRDDWPLKMIAGGANLRTRVFALPYGDQGLLISRAHYEGAGGYADVVLMEDVALARALRKTAPIQLAPCDLVVSSRRWDRDGAWTRTFRNLGLLFRYLAGASPDDLAASYRAESTRKG